MFTNRQDIIAQIQDMGCSIILETDTPELVTRVRELAKANELTGIFKREFRDAHQILKINKGEHKP